MNVGEVAPLCTPPMLATLKNCSTGPVVSTVVVVVEGTTTSWSPPEPAGRSNVSPVSMSKTEKVSMTAAACSMMMTAAASNDGHFVPV